MIAGNLSEPLRGGESLKSIRIQKAKGITGMRSMLLILNPIYYS